MSGRQFNERMTLLNVNLLCNEDPKKIGKLVESAPNKLPELKEQMQDNWYESSWREQLDNEILRVIGVPKSITERLKKQCRKIVKNWIDSIERVKGK